MCGIVGYIGKKATKEILIDGLRELEYRGYDSAGIAILQNGSFNTFKALGKLINLEEKSANFETEGFAVGIGHTRWATHGKPTELNAHPHMGESSYVVHNGIIENYQELKKELQDRGKTFISQTDTEVIVHLFEYYLNSGLESFEAFKTMLSRLEGAFAILLVSATVEGQIFFAKYGSPMILGVNSEDEKFFGSSDAALIGKCDKVIYLEDGAYGYLNADTIVLYDRDDTKLTFHSSSYFKTFSSKRGLSLFYGKRDL